MYSIEKRNDKTIFESYKGSKKGKKKKKSSHRQNNLAHVRPFFVVQIKRTSLPAYDSYTKWCFVNGKSSINFFVLTFG